MTAQPDGTYRFPPYQVPAGWACTGLPRDELLALKDWQSDPLLVDALARVRDMLRVLRRAESDLVFELAARMRERNGTVVAAGILQAVLEPQKEWVCDLEVLSDIQAYITPEEWDELAPLPPAPERKPNKTVGNKLAKRGGPIKAIVDAAWREAPKDPKIVIKETK